MTATAPPKGPGDGLQPERTALVWSRTSFGVLGNVALLLVRDLHGYHDLSDWFPPGSRPSSRC